MIRLPRAAARSFLVAALTIAAADAAIAEPSAQDLEIRAVLLETIAPDPGTTALSVHVEDCVVAVLQTRDGSGQQRLIRFGEIVDVREMEQVYAQDLAGMNLMFADEDARYVSDRFAETLVDDAEALLRVYGVEASFSTYMVSLHRPERGALMSWSRGGGITIRDDPDAIEAAVTALSAYRVDCRAE